MNVSDLIAILERVKTADPEAEIYVRNPGGWLMLVHSVQASTIPIQAHQFVIECAPNLFGPAVGGAA